MVRQVGSSAVGFEVVDDLPGKTPPCFRPLRGESEVNALIVAADPLDEPLDVHAGTESAHRIPVKDHADVGMPDHRLPAQVRPGCNQQIHRLPHPETRALLLQPAAQA